MKSSGPDPMNALPVVCAWCVRLGRQKRPIGPVSDGICQEHALEVLATVGLTLEHLGDGVARPVAIALEHKEAA